MTTPSATLLDRLLRREVIGVCFLLLGLALVMARLVSGVAADGLDGPGADFRDSVFLPSASFVDGVNPYDTEAHLANKPAAARRFPPYLPHQLVVGVPFVPFGWKVGVWLGAVTALGLLAVTILQAGRREGLTPEVGWVATAMALLLFTNPGRSASLAIQPSIYAALGFHMAFASPNPWLAASGVALAATKPQFGLPLVVLLIATGRWRTVLRGAYVAGALAIPVVVGLLTSAGGFGPLLRSFVDNLSDTTGGIRYPVKIDLIGAIRPTAPTWALLAGAVIVLTATVVVVRRLEARNAPPAIVATAASAGTLLSFHHSGYDAVLLIWPAIALAWSGPAIAEWGRLRPFAIGLLAIIAWNPVSLSSLRTALDIPAELRLITAAALIGLLVLADRTRHEFPLNREL